MSETTEIFTLPVRVYYEDTDMAGIVYYANYLRYIERGRSEWVRAVGLDQNHMKDVEGIVFAVRRVEADYISPAKFDDVLTIETEMVSKTAARLILDQRVLREGGELFHARVTLVALTPDGRPTRLPKGAFD